MFFHEENFFVYESGNLLFLDRVRKGIEHMILFR